MRGRLLTSDSDLRLDLGTCVIRVQADSCVNRLGRRGSVKVRQPISSATIKITFGRSAAGP